MSVGIYSVFFSPQTLNRWYPKISINVNEVGNALLLLSFSVTSNSKDSLFRLLNCTSEKIPETKTETEIFTSHWKV